MMCGRCYLNCAYTELRIPIASALAIINQIAGSSSSIHASTTPTTTTTTPTTSGGQSSTPHKGHDTTGPVSAATNHALAGRLILYPLYDICYGMSYIAWDFYCLMT